MMQSPNLTSRRGLLVKAGFGYALILTVLGIVPAGAGHGTYAFVIIAAVPLPVVFWPLVGALLAYADRSTGARLGFLGLLILHYLCVAACLLDHMNDKLFNDALQRHRSVILVFAAIYLLGQGLLWWWFVAVRAASTLKDH